MTEHQRTRGWNGAGDDVRRGNNERKRRRKWETHEMGGTTAALTLIVGDAAPEARLKGAIMIGQGARPVDNCDSAAPVAGCRAERSSPCAEKPGRTGVLPGARAHTRCLSGARYRPDGDLAPASAASDTV